jgi:hypothetical protein
MAELATKSTVRQAVRSLTLRGLLAAIAIVAVLVVIIKL